MVYNPSGRAGHLRARTRSPAYPRSRRRQRREHGRSQALATLPLLAWTHATLGTGLAPPRAFDHDYRFSRCSWHDLSIATTATHARNVAAVPGSLRLFEIADLWLRRPLPTDYTNGAVRASLSYTYDLTASQQLRLSYQSGSNLLASAKSRRLPYDYRRHATQIGANPLTTATTPASLQVRNAWCARRKSALCLQSGFSVARHRL